MAKATPGVVHSILKSAKKDLIDTLSDCAINILNGNVRLSPQRKKKLRRYVKAMRILADKHKTSLAKRKRIVQTGGGMVTTLVGAIVPLLLKAGFSGIQKAIAIGKKRSSTRKRRRLPVRRI